MAAHQEEIDFSDLEEKFSTQFTSPLDSAVILDGAPVVGADRVERLLQAIIKATQREAGLRISREDIDMPMEGDNSKGFMFITLANTTDALTFTRAMHQHSFDKKHTFKVVPFAEVEKYEKLDEEWKEPPITAWKPREHFRAWVADPAGRDQLVLLRGDQTQIVWNNKQGPFEIAHERTNWTESYTQWSPHGTYLATLHAPGVALWAGSSFERLNRFAHPEVKLIEFSPFERYLVTWSLRPIQAPAVPTPSWPFTEDDEGNQIAVWDVLTGALLRTFPMAKEPEKGTAMGDKGSRIVWPMFKWSPDEKYVGRVTPGQAISIYEVPSMVQLGKKSIKIDGVVDFEWCPLNDKEREDLEAERSGTAQKTADGKPKAPSPVRENVIAFWTPEVQNQPARVTLMALPSRTTIRSKNLFNVHDCKIHWQSSGDYLCVKVDRHTKTKKTQYCNLELFRLRDKDCPVQVIELKDGVLDFAWEPKGERFVLITTNDPNFLSGAPGVLLKTSVAFYGFDLRKGDFLQLKTFDNKNSNSIYWSPKGRHVLLATLGSNSKFDLEFWDVDLDRDAEKTDDKDPGGGIRLLSTVEHYGLTAVEWDPSGRFVATAASTWNSSMEPGYAIWDFKGAELQRFNIDKFKQLLWRPRPPTLLSKDDQKRIRKNLREYSRQFEEQDQLDEANVSEELVALRKRLIEEWNSWRAYSKEYLQRRRIELGKEVEVETKVEEVEEVEEWVEEVVDEKIELL